MAMCNDRHNLHLNLNPSLTNVFILWQDIRCWWSLAQLIYLFVCMIGGEDHDKGQWISCNSIKSHNIPSRGCREVLWGTQRYLLKLFLIALCCYQFLEFGRTVILRWFCWHIVAKNYAWQGLQFMAGLALPVWSEGRDLMKSSPWSSKLGFGQWTSHNSPDNNSRYNSIIVWAPLIMCHLEWRRRWKLMVLSPEAQCQAQLGFLCCVLGLVWEIV